MHSGEMSRRYSRFEMVFNVRLTTSKLVRLGCLYVDIEAFSFVYLNNFIKLLSCTQKFSKKYYGYREQMLAIPTMQICI